MHFADLVGCLFGGRIDLDVDFGQIGVSHPGDARIPVVVDRGRGVAAAVGVVGNLGQGVGLRLCARTGEVLQFADLVGGIFGDRVDLGVDGSQVVGIYPGDAGGCVVCHRRRGVGAAVGEVGNLGQGDGLRLCGSIITTATTAAACEASQAQTRQGSASTSQPQATRCCNGQQGRCACDFQRRSHTRIYQF